MNREEMLTRLTMVFRHVFADDTIVLQESTTSADIASWDSLNQIKLILACEKEFNIRLKAREINALSNVGEMMDHIERLVKKH